MSLMVEREEERTRGSDQRGSLPEEGVGTGLGRPSCDLPRPKDSPRQLFEETPLTSESTSVWNSVSAVACFSSSS